MFGLRRLVPAGKALLPAARFHVGQVRNGSSYQWHYREINQNVPKKVLYIAEGFSALMWYWILWHLWYQWGHFSGSDHVYPNPKEWTDAELGIPADEED